MKNCFFQDIAVTKIHFANRVEARFSTPSMHDRSTHGFSTVFNGATVFRFENGTNLTSGNGAIIYLPHHSTYTGESITPGSCYCINFSITEDIRNEPFVFMPKNMAAFENIFKTADKYWMAKRDGYELKCRSLLYEFLYQMQKELSLKYTNRSKFDIIAPAIDYIHANYLNETINIESLAEMCGISHEYLRQLFRLFYNTTPIAYINSMKITRAKELIESGLYSVTEAAMMSGYTDISYFSREFKKATGVSPSLYSK